MDYMLHKMSIFIWVRLRLSLLGSYMAWSFYGQKWKENGKKWKEKEMENEWRAILPESKAKWLYG